MEALAIRQSSAVSDALSVQDVLSQVALIQDVMRSAMRDKEHYGTVPGCGDKPTLLQPGAQKLLLTFRMNPDYAVETVDLQGGHREYRVKCSLTNSSGTFIGAGVGSATTLESKWRYRSENTGKPVPPEYWTTRDPKLLGGSHFSPRKVGGQWFIAHKVEHDNPADYFNTCLKMAKKRALVDAVVTRTAASDIFTQDLEDIKENLEAHGHDAEPAPPPAPAKPEPKPAPQPAFLKLQPFTVVRVAQKSGTKKNGDSWTRYGVLLRDQSGAEAWANSFSESVGCIKEGDKIKATVNPGQKGGLDLSDWEPDTPPGALAEMVEAELQGDE